MGWGSDVSEHPLYMNLMKAFRLFDRNRDGLIDAAELRELLMRGGNADTKGSTMSEADVQALISSFDDNGDGKLSIEELVEAWVTIGGADEDLEAAIQEKRALKAEQAKTAMAKKKEAAAEGEAAKRAAGEEWKQNGKDKETMQQLEAANAAREQAEAETKAAIAEYASQADGSEGNRPTTAAERARQAASAKIGKQVESGQGMLSATKDAGEPAVMTAAERAKLKAKEEFAAKEARKKAAKEAKKKSKTVAV